MNTVKNYITDNKDRFVQELFQLLSIPSISTLSSHKEHVEKAALFVKEHLEKSGADKAYLIPTEGHPLVYAEKKIDVGLPTVLVYGHYDVQPVDPLDLWETPPFEPTIREGRIYARGASDDKGQMYMHIKALEAMLATGTLKCNVKFILEGEEEVGSTHIKRFLGDDQQVDLLEADVVLVSDSAMLSLQTPSIDVSLRGICALEVELEGPKRDLHSGTHGGAVANPAEMLARMLGQLKNDEGKILIPGFYDDVVELSEEERKGLDQVPFDAEQYKASLGVDALFGEKGYTTLERVGIRPSVEVNGIWGGYTGEGFKTVIPSKAYAKISIRTVANQNGYKLADQLEQYLQSICPKGVQVRLRRFQIDEHAFQANTSSKGIRAAAKALETTLGKKPLMTREGGSIPILAAFQRILSADVVNLGFGLESDNIHAPNENFGLDNFYKGIETISSFYRILATLHDGDYL